jgi:DNA polymerase I-like protein with 3'-5' exonuclease and polymerase domains
LADYILRYRATQKTRSTFISRIKTHKDRRVHPSWKSFGTVTGRFSCAGPNLMNLPRWSRALENRVRELYVAPEGHVLIYFDLSQSEMRMAAYLSGDEAFIASCESGDVHTANARILFPEADEMLTRDPKGSYCPRHGDTGSAKAECNCGKPFRDVAKNAGFGILYQADAETIFKFLRSKGFETTLPYVEAMFQLVHQKYARYYEFCEENLRFCRRHGHLREFFSGRIRWFGWFPSITDTSNYPVQGGIAALMNERLGVMHPRLPTGARLVAQIHDACITQARGELKQIEVVKDGKMVLGKDGKPKMKTVAVGSAAEKTLAVIKDVWSQKIVTPTSKKEWVMPIDLKAGKRWSDFG